MSHHMSEFRQEKIARFFDFMDRDKDGYLTVEDFSHNVKYLETMGNKRDKLVRALQRDMMSWWGLYQDDLEDGGRVSKANFLKNCAEYFGDKIVADEVTKHYTLVFDVIDLDGDGKISFEELMSYYKAHDWTDENHVRDVFMKLDENGDGHITRDELAKAGRDCFISDELVLEKEKQSQEASS